jgi:hypothetical protein
MFGSVGSLRTVAALLVSMIAALLVPGAALAAPPANDARAAAEPLTGSLSGRTLAEATTEPGETTICGALNVSATVWFVYTAPAAGLLTVDPTIANRTAGLYRAGEAAPEACGTVARVSVTAGEQIWVQVGRTPAATAFNFSMTVSLAGGVDGDESENAIVVDRGDQTLSVAHANATLRAGESRRCGSTLFTHTVWYRYIVPANGTVAVSVRTGSRAVVIYRNGAAEACTIRTSRPAIVSRVDAGEQLLIQVGRTNSATSFTTTLRIMVTPAPVHDRAVSAELLNGLKGKASGNLVNADTEPGEDLVCGGRSARNTVWFRFVAPARGDLDLRLTPSSLRTLVIQRGSRRFCPSNRRGTFALGKDEHVLIQVGRKSTSTSYTFALTYSFKAEPDQDGDGVAGARGDCNDSDPRISPRKIDLPDDGIDQNCDGVDTRGRRSLKIDLNAVYQSKRNGKRIRRARQPIVGIDSVSTERLRGAATVTLRCSGNGCKRKVQRKVLRSAARVVFRSPLRARDKNRDRFKRVTLELTIVYPRDVGYYRRWVVRQGKPDSSVDQRNRCTYPGGAVRDCA